MAVQIPLRSDLNDYDLQVSLDGVIYTLRFRWNRRESCWYMDVSDESDNPLWMSTKVVIDMPLAYKARGHKTIWPGLLLAVDTSQEHADPGASFDNAGNFVSDLGGRVVLLYWAASELPVDPNAPIPVP